MTLLDPTRFDVKSLTFQFLELNDPIRAKKTATFKENEYNISALEKYLKHVDLVIFTNNLKIDAAY